MGELERKQRVWCLRARCLLAQLDFDEFAEAAEAGTEGADDSEAVNRLKFLGVFTREFEAKRVKYLAAAKQTPEVIEANSLGRGNDTSDKLTQGNIAMIRLRTQARELQRKYTKWRKEKTSKPPMAKRSTTNGRKASKSVTKGAHSPKKLPPSPTPRITSTYAELHPSLPPKSPAKPTRQNSNSLVKPTQAPKSLLPPHNPVSNRGSRNSSVSLDKTHVIRSQSASPLPSHVTSVNVFRAHVRSPSPVPTSPNTLKRVSWVPPDYAPPPQVSPLAKSGLYDAAEAQKRMQRVSRALSSPVLKPKAQLKAKASISPRGRTAAGSALHKSSPRPQRSSSSATVSQKSKPSDAQKIVMPQLPFSIVGRDSHRRSPRKSSESHSIPRSSGWISSAPPEGADTVSMQVKKPITRVARKLRLESVSPTSHPGGSARHRRPFSRSVSAPRVRVTRRKRSRAKTKNPRRRKRPSATASGSGQLSRCRSRSKKPLQVSSEASGLPALQNFISISRAEISGDTLTLRPGTLLFYSRLVFEFDAPFRSPQFHMLSEPEVAAWHVLNLWRDNLARGVKKVPRFGYIHAYRVTSEVEFAVRSAWEIIPDELDQNTVIQDSIARNTSWDKSIRTLDSLKRFFRGLSQDYRHMRSMATVQDQAPLASRCHINSHRSMPHQARPRPCCKLFFGSQKSDQRPPMELTRVYEVDVVEWLERMLEEPCSLNRARILPLLRHPFKMRRQPARSGTSPEDANSNVLSHMFRE